MSNPFANWSADDVRRHNERLERKSLEKYENHSETQGAEPQRIVCDEPLATVQGEKSDSSRVHVRVVSRRVRLIDPDNLCPKYFIDCLRYAEIIQDDTAEKITLEVSQEKVSKGDEETIIEISQEKGRVC